MRHLLRRLIQIDAKRFQHICTTRFTGNRASAVLGDTPACGGNDSGDDETPGTMVEVATRGGFSALVLAATKAGLADELSAPSSNLTLLAPTNDAFALLAGQLGFASIAAMVDALPASTLESILLYHVLPGALSGPDLLAGGPSQNTSLVQGGTTLALALNTVNNDLRIADSIGRISVVGVTDVPNDNGVFHVILQVVGVVRMAEQIRSATGTLSPLHLAFTPNFRGVTLATCRCGRTYGP